MWDKAQCQVDTTPDEGAKLQDKSELSRDEFLPMGQGIGSYVVGRAHQ